MYSEEYDDEQETKTNDNFIVNFYYNNKILIWILIGVIAFILIMSLLTKGGSSNTTTSKGYDVTIISDKEKIEIAIGNIYTLRAKVENNASAKVTWSSENEDIAKIDSNGTITAVNYGTTKVYATYLHNEKDKYVSLPKEVIVADGNPNLKLQDVSFRSGDLIMPLNSTYDIRVSLTPTNGYITNKEFTSSNPSVVTVDNNGHVISVGEGEAIITLNVNNGTFKKDLKVFVNKSYTRSEIVVTPEKITFDGELRKVKIGVSERLKYTVFPTNTDTSKLTWTSSDESIVSVDQNGKITALKTGHAVITLSAINGVHDTIDIEVEESIVEVTDIDLAIGSLYLEVGKNETITPVVSPSNASNKSLSFITGDSSIVSLSPNQTGTSVTVYALSAGTTTITVSSNNNIEKRLTVVVTGGGSSSGSSSSSSSSSSSTAETQGFTISSQDANWARTHEGFIVQSYDRTINNSATAPVKIIATVDSPSIAKLRIAACLYGTNCNPNNSGAHEIVGSGSFTLTNAGTYVLSIGKYNSSGTLTGTVTKYIAIGNTSDDTSATSISCGKTTLNIGEQTTCTARLASGDSVKEWKNLTTNAVYSGNTTAITLEGRTVGSFKWQVTTNNGATATVTVNVVNGSSIVSISCGKTTLNIGEQTTCTARLASGDGVKEWKNLTTNTISSNKTTAITLEGRTVGSFKWQVTTNNGATATVTITVQSSSTGKWSCSVLGAKSKTCSYIKYSSKTAIEAALNNGTTTSPYGCVSVSASLCGVGSSSCYQKYSCAKS